METNAFRRRVLGWLCTAVGICALLANPSGLRAEPKNAAVRYYQACLCRPEPDDYRMFHDMLHDEEPSDQLRSYLSRPAVRETIALAEAGTRIANCDWGGTLTTDPGPGLGGLPLIELNRLIRLLEADTRLLAHEEDDQVVFDRCLAMRRLAAHLTDNSAMLYGMAFDTHARALRCIQYALSLVSSDANTLTWLQGQLKTEPGMFSKPGDAIRRQHNARVDNEFRMLSEYGGDWKKAFLEAIADTKARENARRQTESEILTHARESYMQILESAIDVIRGGAPVEPRYKALAALDREVAERASRGEPLALLRNCWDGLSRWLSNLSAHALWYNSTLVAVEVYLIKAKTGRLPATLPEGLPKAPYTGKDFEYEMTGEGFVLRYLEKGSLGWKRRDIVFRVTDNGGN